MRTAHRCIDGSRVDFETAADLGAQPTSLAAFRLADRGPRQLFEANGPGHTARLWGAGQASGRDYRVERAVHDRISGGDLLTAVVSHAGDAERRVLTVSIWETETGAVVSTTKGDHLDGFHRTMLAVPYESSAEGPSVGLRVLTEPRVPRMLKPIPGRALAIVSPLIRETRATLPRTMKGIAVKGGEAFRTKRRGRAVSVVSRSALVQLEPRDPSDDPVAALEDLVVDWVPRGVR